MLGRAAQGHGVEHLSGRRVADAVHGPVAQDAFVIDRGVPRMRDPVALGVEPPQPRGALAVVGGVAARDREGVRDEGERILEHRAEVEQDPGVVPLGGASPVLPDPKFQVLGAREVHAGRRERLGDGPPPRRHAVGLHPRRGSRGRVGQPQHRVGLKHQPQHRLGRLRLPGQADVRIDVLSEELHGAAVEVHREALPGEEPSVARVEPARDPERGGAAVGGRNAAPVPSGLIQGDEPPALGLELLEVRLPQRIGRRFGHRDLPGDAQKRRRVGVHTGEGVDGLRHPGRLEAQAGRDAADEAGGGLEAERGPGEGALLALEQPRQIDFARLAEVVAGRQAVNGRRRDGEGRPLLELRAHLGDARPEQRVRVAESHLPGRVVDIVVHAAGEQRRADEDALTAVADLEAVERQRGAVLRGRDAGVQVQGEDRGRPLRGEPGARRTVQRVVTLLGRELGGIAERLQVRKDDVRFAQRRPLLRIAVAREEPVVLVEGVRIVREREPEAGEVGLAGVEGPLVLVHGDAELQRRAVHLRTAHAVGAADLEAEGRRVRRHPRPRIVEQSQGVDARRVGHGGDRERPDAAPGARAVQLPGGHVGGGQVVALVEARGQGEPGAAGIDVVIPPLLQHLPLERPRPLVRAIDRSRPDAAGHRAHASDVLVARARRRHRAHPVDPQAADAQRIGERRGVEVQDVDGGLPGDRRGVDGEEEPSRLVVEVPLDAIQRLARRLADRVHAILDEITLLLRVDAAHLHRPELRDGLHAEVVGRDRGADEPRAGDGEGHVPRLDAAQDLVLEPLVPDLEVVVGVEFALAVEVDVHVQALPDHAERANGVLRVRRDRGEARGAPRNRLLPLEHAAAQVAELVGLELEPQVQLHPDVGVLPERIAAPGGLEHARQDRGTGRGGGGRGRRGTGWPGAEAGPPQRPRGSLPARRDDGGGDPRPQASPREQRRHRTDREHHGGNRHDERGAAAGVGRGPLRAGRGYNEGSGEEDDDEGGALHPL